MRRDRLGGLTVTAKLLLDVQISYTVLGIIQNYTKIQVKAVDINLEFFFHGAFVLSSNMF